jgi:N-acetylneuraminic acid mutarotase
MKKIAFFFLVLFCFYFISCKKEDNASGQQETFLKLDKDKIEVSNNIGSKDSFTVQFSGNWTLSVNPSTTTWLKTSAVSGNGNVKVYVTVQEKNTTSSRTATVVVSSQSNVSKSVTITITQDMEKQWQSIAAFPGIGRAAASGFAIGDKFYVGLGWGHKENADQDLGDFYEYNSTTNSWAKKADFPNGRREYAKGFSLNGKGYIAMGQQVECTSSGCTGTIFKDVWEYDASNDAWKKVATFDNLDDNAAVYSQVFVIDDKAYFYFDQHLWAFDPTTYSLTSKANFPALIDGMTMTFFSLNGKGYAVGGYTGTPYTYSKSVYEYDPLADKWNKRGDFPGQGRAGAFGFSVNGKGYIACGGYETIIPPNTSYQTAFLKDVWEYNASIDSWSQVADFPQSVSGPVIGIIGNKAIVGTGFPNPRTTLELGKSFWSY